MTTATQRTVSAFNGDRIIASGPLQSIALAVKTAIGEGASGPLLLFDDDSGRAIDIDTRGSDEEIVERLAQTHPDLIDPPRGKGRPKLGVVAREVTLMPRHWEWLSEQPGGASVMLRKLVDEARRGDRSRIAQAREATYRFMSAMAGNRPHFEEAARALFAGDCEQFERLIARWPADIRNHTRKFAANAFADKAEA